MFDKYGFAGVIVAVLAWFMLRNESTLSKLNDTILENSKLIQKICDKLGD